MIKISTINQIVEAILAQSEYYSPGNCEMIANEAVIYYKTAMICESQGIKEAMDYFMGTHNAEEYKSWVSEVSTIIKKEVEHGKFERDNS